MCLSVNIIDWQFMFTGNQQELHGGMSLLSKHFYPDRRVQPPQQFLRSPDAQAQR